MKSEDVWVKPDFYKVDVVEYARQLFKKGHTPTLEQGILVALEYNRNVRKGAKLLCHPFDGNKICQLTSDQQRQYLYWHVKFIGDQMKFIGDQMR